MKELIITIPIGWITCSLFGVFCLIAIAARKIVRWQLSEEGCKELGEEASHLLTGLAATFAFFVGFAINVTWSAVTAGQSAVEQHASALKQMSWSINSLRDHAEAKVLMDQLRTYATVAAREDHHGLARAQTDHLPSLKPLDQFEQSVHDYASRQRDIDPEVSTLLTQASAVTGTAAQVAAVAQRNPPRILVALLMVSGAIVAGVMGVSTVTSRFPSLLVVWCLIPALSITVVIALLYPFARPIGVDLVPVDTVSQQLIAR